MNNTTTTASAIRHIKGFTYTIDFNETMVSIPWCQQVRQMYGKPVATPRLTHNTTPAELPRPLASVAAELETLLGCKFEQAGCNLYRTGADSVAWHKDLKGSERDNATIAVLSIGGGRRFQTRRNGEKSKTFNVEHGDVFIMSGDAQHTHEHRIPKTSTHAEPRISIAFRSVIDQW